MFRGMYRLDLHDPLDQRMVLGLGVLGQLLLFGQELLVGAGGDLGALHVLEIGKVLVGHFVMELEFLGELTLLKQEWVDQ